MRNDENFLFQWFSIRELNKRKIIIIELLIASKLWIYELLRLFLSLCCWLVQCFPLAYAFCKQIIKLNWMLLFLFSQFFFFLNQKQVFFFINFQNNADLFTQFFFISLLIKFRWISFKAAFYLLLSLNSMEFCFSRFLSVAGKNGFVSLKKKIFYLFFKYYLIKFLLLLLRYFFSFWNLINILLHCLLNFHCLFTFAIFILCAHFRFIILLILHWLNHYLFSFFNVKPHRMKTEYLTKFTFIFFELH